VSRVTGPMFYEETINSDRYVRQMLQQVFTQLIDEEKCYGYLKQDSETVHMIKHSMETWNRVFGKTE
jgi:hypothetical protein